MKGLKGFFTGFLFVVMLAMVVGAASAGDLTRTPGWMIGGGTAVQIHAPDGSATTQTAVTGQVIDLSNYIIYSLYSGSGTCVERLMPASNSTRASYVATPVPNTTWHIRGVNPATPFLNVSGCVAGFVKKQ